MLKSVPLGLILLLMQEAAGSSVWQMCPGYQSLGPPGVHTASSWPIGWRQCCYFTVDFFYFKGLVLKVDLII